MTAARRNPACDVDLSSYRELNPSTFCNLLSLECFCSKETLDDHLALQRYPAHLSCSGTRAMVGSVLPSQQDPKIIMPRGRAISWCRSGPRTLRSLSGTFRAYSDLTPYRSKLWRRRRRKAFCARGGNVKVWLCVSRRFSLSSLVALKGYIYIAGRRMALRCRLRLRLHP